ncbi:MAG: TetR/AcrR family transcriptional regulator [Desulfatiglans sp.]|jgi:AcrR family transcriptional regulator|nr:TetR/AcrR family transcriptional regulator [Thermodesulfobacteriota bacterium]MEE4351557.1 TetR/AcrR family transcriptional regulator [Desulfatiglans sp.]
MKKTNHLQKEDRKRQILNAALDCIVDLGYNNVTMKSISDHSGLSKGAIHHYFKRKEEILLAVLNELDNRLYTVVDDKLKDAKTSEDYLTNRIRGSFEAIKTGQPLFAGLTAFLATIDKNNEYNKLIKSFFSKYRRLTTVGIKKGLEEGIYKDVDLRHLSAILLALMFGLEMQWRFDKEAFEIDDVVEMIEAMVLGFLRKD